MHEIYVIYKITNIITNKLYIGQSKNVQKRLNEHFNWKDKKSYIARSIKKYGKENFTVEILCSAIQASFIDELEVYFINKFNSVVPNGYNLDLGGQQYRIISDQTRSKMSQNRKGKTPWNKGKLATEEAKKNQSLAHLGQKSHFKGKTHTEQTKRYISEIQKGKEKPNKQKPIKAINLKTQEIRYYYKIIEAKKDGFNDSNICAVLKGRRKSYKGYFWKYV